MSVYFSTDIPKKTFRLLNRSLPFFLPDLTPRGTVGTLKTFTWSCGVREMGIRWWYDRVKEYP